MKSIDHDMLYKMKNDINAAIGRQIMLRRKYQGLSGQLLAETIGVSQQQISRYERGVCKIDLDNLIFLLDSLKISLDTFFQKVSKDLSENKSLLYGEYSSVFKIESMNDNSNYNDLIKSGVGTIYFE